MAGGCSGQEGWWGKVGEKDLRREEISKNFGLGRGRGGRQGKGMAAAPSWGQSPFRSTTGTKCFQPVSAASGYMALMRHGSGSRGRGAGCCVLWAPK